MAFIAEQLEKYPFVRLVIPLMLGIVCGDACPMGLYTYGAMLMAVALSAFLLCLLYKRTFLFGMALYLFLFLLGNQLLFVQKQRTTVQWPEEKELYTGLITDKPQEKPHSFLLPLEVKNQKVRLYIAKDSLSEKLQRGNRILFYTKITSPSASQIPGTFDYARYLQHQGITGTAYVGNRYWQSSQSGTSSFSLRQKALDVRDNLLERYKTLGFRGDELAVLSALTLGDKSELNENLKETYSVTGASHVLALSGLHLGILYGIGVFLLSFLHVGKFTHWIRMLCLLGALWSFSFIVGLSASVVRSACMFSLFAVAQCLNRKSISLNTLALSAFIMLLYQPFYLFDVGFQLSYAAVASIVWLHPMVSAWWKPSCRVLRYLWGIISLSLVAQIGVAPLILYYFSRFSVYFLFTNLWVIPLTFCLVAGTVLMLVCGFCFPLQKSIAFLLNELIKIMHGGLNWIERMPSSAVDRIKIETVEVAGFYLLLFLFVSYCIRKNGRYMVGMLVCLVCVFALRTFSLFSIQSSQLLFYHSERGASIQCTYAGKEPFELFSTEELTGLRSFGGKNIVWLKDNSWHNRYAESPFPIDYMFIQRGFTGKISELQSLFKIRNVVLDTSLSVSRQKRLREECKGLKIKVFVLSEKGYLWVKV